jgi:hypothetical protein
MRIVPTVWVGICSTALTLLGGCAADAYYIYRPEENPTASVAGRPAALYQVPPESPHGQVRIAALGIAKLEPSGGEAREVRAMHVRMVVDDNGTVQWTVDTREQIAVLDGAGQSRPAFAASSTGQAPVVTIPPSGSAAVDLYYPLPTAMQKASRVPHFEVLWRIHTAERVVAERTSFERLRIDVTPLPDYAVAEASWWGPGWYDPFWPHFGFYGAVVLPPYAYRPVILARPYPSRARRVR